ncbi:type VI secretion system Vgr family protein [Deferribacter abyssi]|uniref:type VI secretion system Vgr family protein n=1 Tax=Deferribacter abyssi TaxID=213806 RepID=UPI003C2A3EF6
MLSKEDKFLFISYGVDRDIFTVVSFQGEEGLSKLYKFEITLVSEDGYIHPGDIVKNRAKFVIKRKDGKDAVFNGIVSSFEQLHHVDQYTFYKATLVPKLWYLTLTYHNQVFLDKNVKEIVETVLKDSGLTSNDYEFKIKQTYPKNEYVCQFNETHYNFMSRWLEREGLYYYFDQTGDAEKIIITDTKISHLPHPLGDTFYYSPPSGLDYEKRDEIIQSFVCKYNNVPKRVFLKDYNYKKPSLEISGSAIVDKDGIGDVYLYGEHFETPEEGNRLAKIRAEQILCTKEEYIADSTIPYVQPGYTFKLENHYRDDINKNYLIVEVQHEGTQGGYLLSGISKNLSEREKKVFYQNSFKAIPSNIQFKPEKKTQKPLIAGTLHAKIDAEGSGKYAELDEHGRYKVKLPFDISGRKNGKASSWIRLATPYAGSDHGMHFPLHKGTEVLLTFINGDPDRPVIAAAVPNPEAPSQVVDRNQTMNIITTSGGNKIHMQDQEGRQGILLHTPTSDTRFRMGAPLESNIHGENQESEGEDVHGETHEGGHENPVGIELLTKGYFKVESGFFNQTTLGEHGLFVLGSHNKVILVNANDAVLAFKTELNLKEGKLEFSTNKKDISMLKTKIANYLQKITQEKTEINDQNINVNNQNVDVAENNVRAQGEQVEAIGERTGSIGAQTEVRGSHEEVNAERVETTGESVRTNAQSTDISVERNQVNANNNEIHENHNILSSNSNKVTSLKNSIASIFNSIGGLFNFM